MTRARIAIVTTYYRPVMGGAESAAERLATFLRRRGHEVLVLTKRTSAAHPVEQTIDDVGVVRLPPTGERTAWGKWRVLPRLWRTLVRRRGDFDVICCVDYRAIGLAALFARTFTRTPVVFYAQTEGVLSGARVRSWIARLGASPNGALATLATWPVRALYRRADALGCISRGIEREAWAAGMPHSRVHYVPNPVDVQRFSPASATERLAIRTSFGLRVDEIVAVFVGRLSREKGPVELVEAWTRARPDARLALIGPPMTGHPWDVSAEAARIVDAAGMTDRVQFVGGQPPDQVLRWLQAADFAVQPSHFEAMGLAAAEELATGLPVIASDTGGYRDFIVNDVNGLLVPTKDVLALAEALTRLTTDATLRRRLASQARASSEPFDEAVVLERFAIVMDGLASRATKATHG